MKNWIPIKNDYLIDNFESLLDSLSDADFNNPDDGVLIESINILEEVSKDLLSDYFSHKLGCLNQTNDLFLKNVRIVLASIFSSLKLGRTVNIMLTDLLDMLVVNNSYSDEGSLRKIKEIVISLARNNNIETLPYNLRDLLMEKFDFHLFKQQLLKIKIAREQVENVVFDSIGSCLLEGQEIIIYPVSLDEAATSKLKPIMEASLDVKLMSDTKKKISDLDFKEQEIFLSHYRQTFSRGEKLVGRRLKSYSEDQDLYVRVTGIDPVRGFVKCRTIDPDYEPLELHLYLLNFLNLNIEISITQEDFLGLIKPNQVLKVQLSQKDGRQYFSLNATFKEFFTNLDNFTDSYEAIYITDYPGGTRWLTEMGHTVNIMNNNWDNEIKDAASVECEYLIKISNINGKTDKKGNTVMNASRIGDLYELYDDETHDSFRKAIPKNLVDFVLKCWHEECPVFRAQDEPVEKMPAVYPRIIGHLLCTLAEDSTLSFQERFHNAYSAKLLAFMTESQHDESYCDYLLSYLKALWAFARDPGHEWLSPVSVPPELQGLDAIAKLETIIKILSEYKTEHHFSHTVKNNKVDTTRLHSLVNASNALSGNIAQSEINRIKRTITQCLGIESIYTEEASDKFWYGDESEMLEFKTSVVYLPSKSGDEAKPDIQIWQIIKTINGFLNSLHGGTLLLGVNDFGNADGIEKDIQWLYEKRIIVSPDIDKYILYVKNRIDRSFEAYRRKDSATDITSSRVKYSAEKQDCNLVVRIEVSPYEFGCIKIKEKLSLHGNLQIERPSHIKESYIRTANTTEELTPAKKEKLETDKRTVIKDVEQQKQILVQEAIDTSTCIKIRGYQSYRRKSDKIVEPIELLPLRGLLVGVQQGEKELRVFKLNRCESVELTDTKFKASSPNYSVDPFNMLTKDKHDLKIKIRFDRLGWLRIQEVYPYTANFLTEEKNDTEFPYLLECRISDVKGIGSYCLSIPGHFKIIECKGLEQYIRQQIAQFQI